MYCGLSLVFFEYGDTDLHVVIEGRNDSQREPFSLEHVSQLV